MKALVLLAAALSVVGANVGPFQPRVVCYYDSQSYENEGLTKLTLAELAESFEYCTHLVYGYVGIKPDTFEITSINQRLDIQKRHLATVTALKDKFPDIKFLLSVGGGVDRDDHQDKYMKLLEAGRRQQTSFINSARDILRFYNFDGLDLAFQFWRNKPRKVHSSTGMAWKSFKKLFTGDQIVDDKADEHKEELVDLIADLKNALRADNKMLTLTVLPNVNSSWYFNVPAIINNLDYVTLAAFDFLTPERNPEEADYTAPLWDVTADEQNRLPHYNVNFQVEHWVGQRAPKNKINVGMASYGRSWKLTKDSGTNYSPVIHNTDGPAPAGPQTKTSGLLSLSEICLAFKRGARQPLTRVRDPTFRYGYTAFRPVDENGENGVWVSYEDPESAIVKSSYVKHHGLGGVALFDLSMDDRQGACMEGGKKFPLLMAIDYGFTYNQ